MEEAVAKNQRDEKNTTSVADKSNQSGDSKAEKREGVVTTTVIGKPDWGEADKIDEKPLKDEHSTKRQEEKDQDRIDPTSQEKQ